jgi:phage-related protein
MNAYKGDTLQNNKMLVGAFPKLAAGDNNISWAGNVTKIEIVPRWCKL